MVALTIIYQKKLVLSMVANISLTILILALDNILIDHLSNLIMEDILIEEDNLIEVAFVIIEIHLQKRFPSSQKSY
jgi:hypothetical protein